MNKKYIEKLMLESHHWVGTVDGDDICSKCEGDLSSFSYIPFFCDEGGKDFSSIPYFPNSVEVSIRELVLFYEKWVWSITDELKKFQYDKVIEKVALEDFMPKDINNETWQRGYKYGLDTATKILKGDGHRLEYIPTLVKERLLKEEKQ